MNELGKAFVAMLESGDNVKSYFKPSLSLRARRVITYYFGNSFTPENVSTLSPLEIIIAPNCGSATVRNIAVWLSYHGLQLSACTTPENELKAQKLLKTANGDTHDARTCADHHSEGLSD